MLTTPALAPQDSPRAEALRQVANRIELLKSEEQSFEALRTPPAALWQAVAQLELVVGLRGRSPDARDHGGRISDSGSAVPGTQRAAPAVDAPAAPVTAEPRSAPLSGPSGGGEPRQRPPSRLRSVHSAAEPSSPRGHGAVEATTEVDQDVEVDTTFASSQTNSPRDLTFRLSPRASSTPARCKEKAPTMEAPSVPAMWQLTEVEERLGRLDRRVTSLVGQVSSLAEIYHRVETSSQTVPPLDRAPAGRVRSQECDLEDAKLLYRLHARVEALAEGLSREARIRQEAISRLEAQSRQGCQMVTEAAAATAVTAPSARSTMPATPAAAARGPAVVVPVVTQPARSLSPTRRTEPVTGQVLDESAQRCRLQVPASSRVHRFSPDAQTPGSRHSSASPNAEVRCLGFDTTTQQLPSAAAVTSTAAAEQLRWELAAASAALRGAGAAGEAAATRDSTGRARSRSGRAQVAGCPVAPSSVPVPGIPGAPWCKGGLPSYGHGPPHPTAAGAAYNQQLQLQQLQQRQQQRLLTFQQLQHLEGSAASAGAPPDWLGGGPASTIERLAGDAMGRMSPRLPRAPPAHQGLTPPVPLGATLPWTQRLSAGLPPGMPPSPTPGLHGCSAAGSPASWHGLGPSPGPYPLPLVCP